MPTGRINQHGGKTGKKQCARIFLPHPNCVLHRETENDVVSLNISSRYPHSRNNNVFKAVAFKTKINVQRARRSVGSRAVKLRSKYDHYLTKISVITSKVRTTVTSNVSLTLIVINFWFRAFRIQCPNYNAHANYDVRSKYVSLIH